MIKECGYKNTKLTIKDVANISRAKQNIYYYDLTNSEKKQFSFFCYKRIKCLNKPKGMIWKTVFKIEGWYLKWFKKQNNIPFHPIIFDLCEEIIREAPDSRCLFRIDADDEYFTAIPTVLHEYYHYSFDNMTIHQKATILKGYLVNVLNGLIPKKVVREIKCAIKNNKTQINSVIYEVALYLPFILDRSRHDLLKMIFDIWRSIENNKNSTQMTTEELAQIFAPIFFGEDIMKFVEDEKIMIDMLKRLYKADFLYIYDYLYCEFRLCMDEK